MIVGMVPVSYVQAAENDGVVYVDGSTSMSELVEQGIVQMDEPVTEPTMPETPTNQGLLTVPDLDQPVQAPVQDSEETEQTPVAPALSVCDCGMENADIYNHSDNCALRLYYYRICAGDPALVYDLWRNVSQVTRGFIEDYLNANYPGKLSEVLKLRSSEAALDDSQAEEENAPTRLPGEASTTVDGITLDAVGVPEGSSLTIQEPSRDAKELVEQIVADAEDEPEEVFFYDISVQNSESNDWQPDGTSVELKLSLPGKKLNQYTEVRIIHVDDEGNDSLIKGIVDENGDIVFETGGFSTFAGFTVDFTYGSAMVSIPGKTSTTLGTLFQKMKMPLNAADVVDVQFTDYSLLTVTKEENDWRLTSLVPFTSHETLTFTMADGNSYEFMVTDAQFASIKTGINGTVYNDDNGHSRWFADADGTLLSGNTVGKWQSAYWASDAIVYIMGPGTFTIAIQPHKDLSKSATVCKVKMKQVRIMDGADVSFYVGTHFIAPAADTYGSTTSTWKKMQTVELISTNVDESLFYVDKGTLNLEGDYRKNSETGSYQEIKLKLIGSNTPNTETFTAEPLVNLRENCTKFTADRLIFDGSASGGVFSQAKKMTLFKMTRCDFLNTVYREKIYDKKWVYMNGGAIYMNVGKDGAEKTIDYFYLYKCNFNGNKAGSYGGAIFLGDRIRMAYINSCEFTDCTSGASGGAICLRATIGQFHAYKTKFTNCTAKKDGGGISAETFAMNEGADGEGTNFNRAYEIRLTETTFTNCKATGAHSETNDGCGGGVNLTIQCEKVNINKCTFDGCQALGGSTNLAGGGIAFGYANLGDTGNNPTGDMRLPWTEELLFHKRDGDGYLVDADGNRILSDTDGDSSTDPVAIYEAKYDTENKRVLYGEGIYRDEHQGWWLSDPNDDGNESDACWRQRITFGNVYISNDTIFKNASNTHQGGGFIVRTGCCMEDLTVNDTTFDNNSVTDKGSAVFFNNCIIGATKFNNCTFMNNKVVNSIYSGGGTFRTVGQTSSQMTLDGCKFLDNVANQAGGGIYWNAGQTRKTPEGKGGETKAIIKNCEFRRNTALKPDGIEDKKDDGTVVTIDRYGGGIFCETDMTIESCIFDGNKSEIGGGLCMGVYNATYRMFNDNETTRLHLDENTEFFHNQAERGGGLAIRANATLAIDNDTQLNHTVEFNLGGAKVHNNCASEVGGGIYYIAETYQAKADDPSYDPELDNAEVRRYIKTINLDSGTVYSNCAMTDGGGIYIASSYNTTVNVSDAEIYYNAAGMDRTFQYTSTGVNECTCEQDRYYVSDPGGNGGGIYMTGADAIVNITGGIIGGHMVDDTLKAAGNVAYGRTEITTGGYGGGLALFGGANLSITGGQIIYNKAQRDGGGFSVNDNADVTITGGYIQHNKADTKNNDAGIGKYYGVGGGIAMNGGSMTCYGGVIQQNTAYNGGAIALHSGATMEMKPATTVVDGETVTTYVLIDNNEAYNWGGGVYLANAANTANKNQLTIENGTISYNTAKTQNGGGVYVGAYSDLVMNGGEINNNTTATWGGGIWVGGSEAKVTLKGGKIHHNTTPMNGGGLCAQSYGFIKLDGTEIYNNEAKEGGGIFATINAKVEVHSGKVHHNTATATGGGLSVIASSTIKIIGGEIYQNNAVDGGGLSIGDYNNRAVVLTLADGKIYGNTASNNGGGISLVGSNATLQGGDIYGNTAISGGGIFLNKSKYQSSELKITDGKIHENSAVFDQDGYYGNGGGIYTVESKVTLEGGKLYSNHAVDKGGAMFSNTSEIIVKNGEIYDNRATNLLDPDAEGAMGDGGALYIYMGTVDISGGEIKNNSALGSGGGTFMDRATVNITDGLMSGNSAMADAGGLYVSGGTATIGGGTFTDNTSATYGGGAYFRGTAVTFANGTFTDNASKNGGGLCITNAEVEFTGGTFTNNVADRGGAVFIRSSDVTIEGIEVNDNHAEADDRYGAANYQRGGGICVDTYGEGPANVTINGGTFTGNSAKYGGGLWINNNAKEENKVNVATIVINGGNISGNHARADGGGIWISGDDYATDTLKTSLTIAGGVIGQNEQIEGSAGNTAAGNGGGIYAADKAQVFITGTTEQHGEINRNTAKNGGGIFVTAGADLTVTDGHITNNQAVSPANAEELLTGHFSDAYLADMHGTGGGIFVCNGLSDANSTFTLTGTNVAIYGNQASFSGDDVFSNGRQTKLDVPMVSTMNLAGYGFKPEGWFEDYNTGDSFYVLGLNMITQNGSSVTQNGERYEGVLRYRNANATERRFMHIKPEGANGENYVLGEENASYAYVNMENAYVAMTLGIPAAMDDTVVMDYGNKIQIGVWENDLFMNPDDFAMEEKLSDASTLRGSYIGKIFPASLLSEKDNVFYSTATWPKHLDDQTLYYRYFQGNYGKVETGAKLQDASGNSLNPDGQLNGMIIYTPDGSKQMDKAETFYYTVKHNGIWYYANVTIVPASTLYFEDNSGLVKYHKDSDSKETLASWQTVGTAGDMTQDEDRPGTSMLEGLDADNIYGFDSSYTGTTTYSNNAAHWVQASRHKPVDNNGDGTCDKCNKQVSHDWKDTNSDGVCDVCKASCNHHCKDTNGDNKCNTCGKWMVHTCVDANSDYRCDICGGWFEHELNGFSNDAVCDSCGDMIHHSCEDTNGDYQCDTCHRILDHVCSNQSGSYWCEFCRRWIEHQWVDQNEDNKCDTCKNRQHHECADADDDHKCDVCHLWMQHTCADENGDYWCDICGLWMIHNWKDTDGNQICDTCDHVNHHDCRDANRDDACDICSRWMKHDCIDNKAPKNYCDVCGMSVGTHTVAARASFTFTGTGFDIVSLCNNKTGIVMVSVYKGEVVDFDNPPYDRYVASYMVDNHYGYAYNETTGKWEVNDESATSLYQVPVIKADLTNVVIVQDDPNTPDVDEGVYEDYGYGTYSVELYIAPSFLENDAGYWSTDFYLDGIRIYNPAGYDGIYSYEYDAVKRDSNGNPVYENGMPVYEKVTVSNNTTTIKDAYTTDGEAWPTYTELRNLFINQKDLGVTSTEGILFIDGKGSTAQLSDYTSWGPNNEVYLNPGEHIAFTMDTSAYAKNVAGIHVGMRGLTGMGNVVVKAGESAEDAVALVNTKLSTTDMYFDISAKDADGNLAIGDKVVVISNPAMVKDANGNEVTNTVPISITNVKVTHTDVPDHGFSFGRMASVDENTAQIALEILAVEDLVEPIVTPERPALSFNGMISYNVFFNAKNLGDLTADDLGLAVFSSEDTEGTIETAREVIYGATQIDGQYMIATSGVHAKYLGDKQYFRVFAKTAEGNYIYSKMVSYSAVDYARNVLAKSNDVKLKQLVSAMLIYGAEAQKFFGYKADDLMSKYLTNGDKAMLEGFSASSLNAVGKVDATKVGAFDSTGGYSKKSPAISFKGAFEINYFFTPANAVDGDMKLYFWNEDTYSNVSELTAENADKVVTMTLENGAYTATSDEIAAKHLDRTVYVAAVYESNGVSYCSGVLPYSIAAYCQNPPAGVQDLASAAAIYGCTAKQYFGL